MENVKAHAPTIAPRVIKKSISKTQRDISDWKHALRLSQLVQNPKFVLLQELYNDIVNDALLSSQINNRHERTVASPFELLAKDSLKPDDKATACLESLFFVPDLIKSMLDSELYGYSLIELTAKNGNPSMELIPRTHLDPVNGRFYPDPVQNTFIAYREAKEYGKWLLEFNSGHIGLLNKTVNHVLFKKFAQSCWSELCEIFGIPPRYVKTNTQDEAMLNRAENMLSEMGAAAAFVIDTTEEFQFAQGVSTNGDVYNNLIRLCNSEMSMLISGAIIGQDTEHGNYSKEQSSQNILAQLVDADKRMVESYFNQIILPAFIAIGWMPAGNYLFRFADVEDKAATWQLVKDIIPFKDVDNKWLEDKFGIPVRDRSLSEDGELSAKNIKFLEHITGGDPDFFA
jgi:phage gp29-like protein